MIRVSIRIAVIAFALVTASWAGREAYAPGRQYDFPWLASAILAVIAGTAAAWWHHRRRPRNIRPGRPRRSDPGA